VIRFYVYPIFHLLIHQFEHPIHYEATFTPLNPVGTFSTNFVFPEHPCSSRIVHEGNDRVSTDLSSVLAPDLYYREIIAPGGSKQTKTMRIY